MTISLTVIFRNYLEPDKLASHASLKTIIIEDSFNQIHTFMKI